MVDPIELNYMEYLAAQRKADMENIQLCRDYYSGEQTVFLTERMKEFLQLHNSSVTFRMNICRVVIMALLDELVLTGFSVNGDKTGSTQQELNQWMDDVYRYNKLDELQNKVHEAILRDRETFIIVDWDEEKRMPRLSHNDVYVGTDAGGDGYGCWMIYTDESPNEPSAAVKQWTETVMRPGGTQRTRQRRTVYYPDRIERYYYDGGWKQYTEDGQPFPIPLIDSSGRPLGLPVIHFQNSDDQSEIWEVIPQQDAINKLALDVLGTADIAGFPVLVTFGFDAVDDNGDPIKLAPMQMFGTMKDKNTVDVKKIEATDVTPLVNTLTTWIALAANITGTPLSRFIMTGQIASSETLKEQDKPLQRKAQRRRVAWGNSWVRVMEVARRFANKYDAAGLDESSSITAEWKLEYTQEQLRDMLTFGVPQEFIWRKIGLSSEEIEAIKESDEYRINIKAKIWKAVRDGNGEPVPAEIILSDMGYGQEQLGDFATAKMNAILAEQEDVMPEGINL